MEDQVLVRECDQCGHKFKQSTRFKNQQDKAKFDQEIRQWVVLLANNGTPEGDLKHFCKNLCAIQFLQKDQTKQDEEKKLTEAANG